MAVNQKQSKVVWKGGKFHKLKYWREKLGLKQADLAVLLGCQAPNYSQKENGKSEFKLSEVVRITDAFNKLSDKKGFGILTIDDLFIE